MVDGSGLDAICAVGKNLNELLLKVKEYLLLDYSSLYFNNRKEFLSEHFNNTKSAQSLIDATDFSADSTPKQRSDKEVLKSLSQLSSFMSYFSL
jgi:hypothetical protein